MRHGSNIAAVSLLLIWGILGAFGTGSLAGESPYKSEGVIESIDRAADAGVITQGERLVYRLQAVMTPERLPAEFKTASQQLLKCGTSIVEEVVSNWETLTPEQQALAASYFARPSTESTYLSQSGHFLIHYNVT
ncbi:MAG: hypothetical protein HRF51_04965, partial [bacterium]